MGNERREKATEMSSTDKMRLCVSVEAAAVFLFFPLGIFKFLWMFN